MLLSGFDWVSEEFDGICLGDKRLDKRAIKILESFSRSPESSIPDSQRSWSETLAVYRFLENTKVTHSKILEPHIQSTLKRCGNSDVILAIQDTSSLNYSGLKATTGLGNIGDGKSSSQIGLMMHTCYAVSDGGLPLGILGQKSWARSESKFKKAVDRHAASIDEKESNKWLELLESTSEATKGLGVKVIHVMDREADIYDVFEDAQKLNEDFIIRAKHNRTINKSSKYSKDGESLMGALQSRKSLGKVDIELPEPGGGVRDVTAELKAMQFRLTRPTTSISNHGEPESGVTMTIIQLREVSDDEEDPIIWNILTNRPINTVDGIMYCIKCYCIRWQIEVLHRIMKTVCRVERCRLSDANKIDVFLAFITIVAWRFHWLTHLHRTCPEASPDVAFTPIEQKILPPGGHVYLVLGLCAQFAYDGVGFFNPHGFAFRVGAQLIKP